MLILSSNQGILLQKRARRVETDTQRTVWAFQLAFSFLLLFLAMASYKLKSDLAVRKRAEMAVAASEEKYRLLMEQASDGVVLVDRLGNYIEANPMACDTLGYARSELLAMNIAQVIAPENLLERSLLEDRGAARRGILFERVLMQKDGRRFPVEISAKLLESGAMQAIVRDVTGRKQAEEALQRLATHDSLTGLLNRREMDRLLNKEAARSRRYNRPLSVIMADIDHFKMVNDEYGHKVGDEVLRYIGGIFRDGVRSTDHPARYGGEELAIILPETDDHHAMRLAERFRRMIAEKPFTYHTPDGDMLEIAVTVSIGVAELPSDARMPDALLIAADRALYRAKRAGRNRVISYSSPHSTITGRLLASTR